MNKFRLLLFICISSPFLTINAQSVLPFSSDRPGLQVSPLTVGKHYLQMQFGGSYGHSSSGFYSIFSQTARHWNNDYFFRFGLSQKTELNLGFHLANTQGLTAGSIIPPFYSEYAHFSHPTRLNGIRAGIRHTFFTEFDHAFSLGMLILFNSNYNNSFGGLGEYGYNFSLLGSKQIGSRILATANVGIQHKDSWTGPELNYLVNLAFDMGYNLGLFVETKNEAVLIDYHDMIQWYNTGIFWRLTPNFMLDIHGGYNRFVSYRYTENYLYAAMGLSWKIKAIANKKPVAP